MKTYKHEFQKFDLATIRLTERERMVYLRFLWHLYEKEELIPKERDELQYISFCDDEDMVKKILRLYFDETTEGYNHPFVAKKLMSAQSLRQRMSGVVEKSWVVSPDTQKFYDSLPKEKDYQHKGFASSLVSVFRTNKSKIKIKELIEFSNSYFKYHTDAKFRKSPKKIIEEYLNNPKFRYGQEETKNYTKGVK